jgi:putative hydrolase of the HAD superfamily
MIKAVFIDMDDTLIVNQVLYEKAQAVFSGYMHNFGITEEELDNVFGQIDRENFKTLGYSRERMPSSFEKTLQHFIPDADAEMIATVRGFAEKIFTTVARVKPDVEDAFALLSDHFPIYLVTQGDRTVQENRVQHLPFKDLFAGIHIVDKKDTAVYSNLLQKYGLTAEETVMIGDSLKSDILPSVAVGMHAIWIEAHNSSLEAIPDNSRDHAHKYGSLLEAAVHLVIHGTPERELHPVIAARKQIAPKKSL